MSPDAKWVASGSDDGSLKIWDRTADKLLANFEFPNQQVSCLQFNPKTLTLANGSSDRTVKYWDLESMSNITKTSFDTSGILNVQFSRENPEHLFACSQDNIKLWNIETNQVLDCLATPPKPIADFELNFDRRFLFLATIQSNNLAIYYQSFDQLNFDDSVDTVPSQGAHI